MTTSAWSTIAVDAATGASPHTIPGAAIRPLIWPLNNPDTVTIDLRTIDPDLGQFLDPTREIQVWRDGTIWFWGPVVRIEIDDDIAHFQCSDPRWYLTRRFFGKADRTNLLTNGDFEDGATGWAGVGLVPIVDPTRAVQGRRSIRLTGASLGHDTYLHQTYTHGFGSHPLGDLVTVAGWVWISSDDYAGEATDSLGLFVEHRNAGGTLLHIGIDGGTIDGSTPRGQWVRREVSVPAVYEGDTVEVRLYPPFGTAWWDLVTATFMESLSFIEQDLATIIHGIVAYAQGRPTISGTFDHGKSDLNLDVDCPPTGMTLSHTWQFADHENIGEALAGFTRWVDYHVAVTGTTRTLVVSYPNRGVDRDDIALVYGVGGNIAKFRWSHDRVQKADTVVVLGPGDGPDREEGGASATPNGPTLEDVTVAPDGTPVGELDRAAVERLAVVTHPEVLEVTCRDLLGVLNVGDWVPVTIPPLALDSVSYRAVQITPDPANDTIVVSLNLREPITPEEAMARFPRAVDACLAPGGGVWVVGSDGGVGSFGAATFHGSAAGVALNAPMVAIVPHGPDGYWLVGADTGVFAFGDAPVRGSYLAMIDTEYAAGDRAIIAAEPFDPEGEDNLVMIADDGALYYGDLT